MSRRRLVALSFDVSAYAFVLKHVAGIHLIRDVKLWVKGTSHLCIGQVKMTPTVLRAVASLAHIVTIDYLDEVLRLGSLTGSATDRPSLETSFELPNPADFFPQYISPELSPEEGKQALQRNPARAQLFAGTTALIIHTGDELDSVSQGTYNSTSPIF